MADLLETTGEAALHMIHVAPIEAIGAEIVERLAAGQERIDDPEDRVADGHEGALGTRLAARRRY